MLKYHARRPAIHHEHAEGVRLARLALIVNVGDAAFWTILPLHLALLAGGDGPVGFYFGFIALIGALASVGSAAAFRRYRKVTIGVVSLILMAALLVGMSTATSIWWLAAFDVPRSIAFMLVTIALGLMVRDHATAADLAIQEGRYYLYANLGWLVGPLIAGYTAKYWGNEATFAVTGVIFVIALAYLSGLHLSSHPSVATEGDVDVGTELIASIRSFLARPRLRAVFVLALGLELWWIVSSIYIPLAVVDLGYGPDVVGWIVTAGILPLVALEAWVGRKAQLAGTRPYILAGFLVLSVGALSFPFLGFSPALLLFMFAAINIGAALIEPLTDTYFFEVATEAESAQYFGIYNASTPLASLFGPVIGATVFTIGLGLNGVWVVTAILLALCARVALRITAPA